MSQAPGVIVAAVLAVACAVGGLATLSQPSEGLLLLGVAALHAVYAACVRRKRKPGAPTRLLRATRVVLVLEGIAGTAFAVVGATVNMSCRDCEDAAILIVAPLFFAAVLTALAMVLELVVLLVLFLTRDERNRER